MNLYSQENRQKYAALLGVEYIGNSSVQGAIVKELKKYYGVGSPCRTLLYCLRLAALYYFFTSPTISAAWSGTTGLAAMPAVNGS